MLVLDLSNNPVVVMVIMSAVMADVVMADVEMVVIFNQMVVILTQMAVTLIQMVVIFNQTVVVFNQMAVLDPIQMGALVQKALIHITDSNDTICNKFLKFN